MYTQCKILILTMGGTIDKVYFDAASDYEVGESVLSELLAHAHVKSTFEIQSVMRKDSLEMTAEDRQALYRIVCDTEYEKIIVTHGTDTMTLSAAALSAVENKTIVITGALAPARFASSDATFNVGMAFAAVQSLASGVYIVMNGQVFKGDEVKKDRVNNQFVQIDTPELKY
ncbi:MAG: asparaginase [Pseudomonadales bacterium]|nr:asparaginase [Pseudomonadales bacterium]